MEIQLYSIPLNDVNFPPLLNATQKQRKIRYNSKRLETYLYSWENALHTDLNYSSECTLLCVCSGTVGKQDRGIRKERILKL